MLEGRPKMNIQQVTSEAALKALPPSSIGDLVSVRENWSAYAARFAWIPDMTGESSVLGIIKPDSLTVGSPGRWVFQIWEEVTKWKQPSDFSSLLTWWEADDYCPGNNWTSRAGSQTVAIPLSNQARSSGGPLPNGAKHVQSGFNNGANTLPASWNVSGGLTQFFVGEMINAGTVLIPFGTNSSTFLWCLFGSGNGLHINSASGVSTQWFDNATLSALSGRGFACAVSWEFASKRVRGVMRVAGDSSLWSYQIDTVVANMNTAPAGTTMQYSSNGRNVGRAGMIGSAFTTDQLKELTLANCREFGL